jgi:tripartite-type tricarboxylate transporter receptor subunit TctC
MACSPIGSSPQECAAFFKSDMDTWGKVIQDAGLKAE